MPTIPALFVSCVKQAPYKHFIHAREETIWKAYTREEALDIVAGTAQRLYSLGVKKGTVVAIWADTSKEWMVADLAIQSLGAISVGIYSTLTPAQVAQQLGDCKAEMLIVQSQDLYEKAESELDELYELVHILSIDECEDLLPLRPAEADLEFFAQQVSLVQSNDIACIVYTSGTTGESKGVPLSHDNFVSNLHATQEYAPLPPNQRSIVCLPMAHSLQRFATYRAFLEDVEGYVCPLSDFATVLPEVKPTLLIAVPRMLEKIQAAAEKKIQERGLIASSLYSWAKQVAYSSRDGTRIRIQKQLAHRIFFSKIYHALGGSLTHIFCGGAPLHVKNARWFSAMGILVQEGWGLSESCAPATLNPSHDIRFGSVGKALPNTEIRIANDGEILIRGEGIFTGYLHRPAETQDAFTADRFFKTGDLGRLDEDGYLYITGRKKDIIITAGGKNISPARISAIMQGGIIEALIVIGDQKPYLSALVAIDPDVTFSEDEIQTRVERQIAEGNKKLAPFEQIKKYKILPESPSVENGFRTPTQKIRRKALIQKYADLF
ncbi:MAG: long-chain fatty acid--CoA ligase [Myxococcota bacterium]|nr:long-chain fatty acid--CoA ligase [Myxococcota bacterium]